MQFQEFFLELGGGVPKYITVKTMRDGSSDLFVLLEVTSSNFLKEILIFTHLKYTGPKLGTQSGQVCNAPDVEQGSEKTCNESNQSLPEGQK